MGDVASLRSRGPKVAFRSAKGLLSQGESWGEGLAPRANRRQIAPEQSFFGAKVESCRRTNQNLNPKPLRSEAAGFRESPRRAIAAVRLPDMQISARITESRIVT